MWLSRSTWQLFVHVTLGIYLGQGYCAVTPKPQHDDQIILTLPREDEKKWFDKDMDELVEKAMDMFHVPGVSVAVIDGSKTFAKGYGRANDTHNVTPETLFQTGSTTKAFTAAAMSLLVDDQDNYPNLTWSTPISSILPEDFVLSEEQWTDLITLEDALSHQSGMPRHDQSYGGDRNTTREVVRSLRYLPFAAEPRSKYIYNNMMYATVGYVIETLTGQPLEDYFSDKIWKPLGMHTTFLSVKDAQNSNSPLAQGYVWENDTQKFRSIEHMDLSPIKGAGAIASSVLDYSKWIRMMLRKQKPISEAGHRELVKGRVALPDQPQLPLNNVTYSLGWIEEVYRGSNIVQHAGSLKGFGSQIIYLPDQEFGLVVMASTYLTSNLLAQTIARALVDKFLEVPETECFDWMKNAHSEYQIHLASQDEATFRDILFPPKTTPITPMPRPIASYAGLYCSPGYQCLQLVVKDEATLDIMFHHTWSSQITAQHVTRDDFFVVGKNSDMGSKIFSKAVFQEGEVSEPDQVGVLIEPQIDELTWFTRQ